jgi:hypothetical protein
MSRTRAELDQKIARLEARARTWLPSSVAARYMPEYPVNLAIGGLLTLIGTGMAWRRYRSVLGRREKVRAAFASYGRW